MKWAVEDRSEGIARRRAGGGTRRGAVAGSVVEGGASHAIACPTSREVLGTQ